MCVALGAVAIRTNTESTAIEPFSMTGEFYSEARDSLHCTTCDFTNTVGGTIASSLADYTFFSMQAYRSENVTTSDMDQWFGPDQVLERPDIVQEFRKSEGDIIPVYYKLFIGTGSEGGQVALISIRGSHNAWDFLADGQLWSAAIFMQVLRYVLPAGNIWTPILDEMVVLLGAIQSGTIDQLSFYMPL